MKLVDVNSSTYTDFNEENNEEDPEFKFGGHVSILYYKNIFAKGYVPNWSEEVFVIKKVKNTALWTYIINNVNSEEIFGTFYKKEFCKNQIKRISELKK